MQWEVTGHISPVVKVHRQRGARIKTKWSAQIDLATIRRSTIGAGQKTAVSGKKDEWEMGRRDCRRNYVRRVCTMYISNGREKAGDRHRLLLEPAEKQRTDSVRLLDERLLSNSIILTSWFFWTQEGRFDICFILIIIRINRFLTATILIESWKVEGGRRIGKVCVGKERETGMSMPYVEYQTCYGNRGCKTILFTKSANSLERL